MKLETGLYTVKTAETGAELEQALRLRHEVFRREMPGAPLPSGLDTDRFDPLCDHMIVQTRDTGRVVATYRLNPSATGDYYARRESLSACGALPRERNWPCWQLNSGRQRPRLSG